MMRQPLSLRFQLLLWLIAPLLAINVIAIADTWKSARNQADEILDRVLAGSVLAIADRVIISETGDLEVDIPYVALEMLTSSSQDRVFYRIDREDGEFVTGYKALQAVSEDPPRPGTMVFGNASYQGAAIRFARRDGAVSTGSRSVGFQVTVAETTTAREKLANSLLYSSLIRQALLLAIAPILVWWGVARALAPLYALRDAIGRRSPGDLRPIAHDVPQEMQGMLEATNGFLARLRSALEAMRHFAGNASHQLRTPLAIVRTNLALAQRTQSLDEARQLAAQADEAVAGAERTLAQLLVLARVDETASQKIAKIPTDIAVLVRDLAAEVAPGAARKGTDLGYDGPDNLTAAVEPVLLREALRNLLDNAIRYGGKHATLRVIEGPADCIIEIEDDGEGLPDAMLEHAGERFFRPLRKNGRSERDGAGLGLAIAREIAELHGGRFGTGHAPRGGLIVRVSLPLQSN
ncbi:MAG: sensor histidine kinase [Nitratireductor sp.]|nr:sensor histidine kinase [Nitratireductor sp.]